MLSWTWESPYLGKTVYILTQSSDVFNKSIRHSSLMLADDQWMILYLKQCCLIVNWNLRNKLQNLNENTILLQKISFTMTFVNWWPFYLSISVLKSVSIYSILTQTNINCQHTTAPLSLGHIQRPPNGHIVLVFAGPTILAPKEKYCQDRIRTSYSMGWHFPTILRNRSLYTEKNFQRWKDRNKLYQDVNQKDYKNNYVAYIHSRNMSILNAFNIFSQIMLLRTFSIWLWSLLQLSRNSSIVQIHLTHADDYNKLCCVKLTSMIPTSAITRP